MPGCCPNSGSTGVLRELHVECLCPRTFHQEREAERKCNELDKEFQHCLQYATDAGMCWLMIYLQQQLSLQELEELVTAFSRRIGGPVPSSVAAHVPYIHVCSDFLHSSDDWFEKSPTDDRWHKFTFAVVPRGVSTVARDSERFRPGHDGYVWALFVGVLAKRTSPVDKQHIINTMSVVSRLPIAEVAQVVASPSRVGLPSVPEGFVTAEGKPPSAGGSWTSAADKSIGDLPFPINDGKGGLLWIDPKTKPSILDRPATRYEDAPYGCVKVADGKGGVLWLDPRTNVSYPAEHENKL